MAKMRGHQTTMSELTPTDGTDAPVTFRSLRSAARELYANRLILGNFVRRDFTSKHMNSFLGTLWSVLNPLLMVVVYSVVFQFVFRAAPKDISYPYAVFFFGGLVIWNLVGPTVQDASGSIVNNSFLIQKVYVPREIFPISVVMGAGVTFIFELVVLAIFMVIFRVVPDWTIVLFPIFPVMAMLFSVGLGLFVSALNVRFRDVEHFIGVGVQLVFFLTPILWSFSQFTNPTLARLLHLNPVSPMVSGFRDVVLDGRLPQWDWLGYSAIWIVGLLFFGYIFFNRQEPFFAELT